MSERAVLYARVSGDDRGKDNLEGQIEMGREYAQEHGYTVVKEIKEDDRGARGASFDLPGLNQALEMAHDGEFGVLIVRELDRFARKLAKQLIVGEEFRRAGVEVEYVLGEYPDTPEGNLNKQIRAVIAEYEATKISERMKRGRRRKVKEGNVMIFGNPPYGYKEVKHRRKDSDPDHPKFDYRLEIHEPEAQIVRMIFRLYAEGDGEGNPVTIDGIARKLSAMNILTFTDTRTRKVGRKRKAHRRGKWSRGTVHRMLTNETYIGVWRYGKRNNRDGRWKKNPSDHHLIVKVPEIVSREAWEVVQLKLKQNRQNRGQRKHEYLLSRRVTCGACKLKMDSLTTECARGKGKYSYYRCPASRSTGKVRHARVCSAPSFKVDQVDAAVWEWVKSFLADPVALQVGLEKHQTEQGEANTPLRERLEVVEDLMAENQAQLELLLDLYLSGDFPKEVLMERKIRLEATVKALEREQANLVAGLEAQALTQKQIKDVQEFAAKIAKGLGVADQDFARRRCIIELLDVQATLVVEDGKKVVYASCLLGEQVLTDVQEHKSRFRARL